MRRRAEDGITRRDFLEGSLIAAGGLAVLGSFPARALAHYPPGTTFPPDGPIGLDPRVLRGGNLRATFDIAHLLRDERLTWGKNTVKVASSTSDNLGGTYQISADTGTYDLIVVGFALGLAGFAAHAARLEVDWAVLGAGLAGALPGAWFGARLAALASELTLRRAIGVALLAVAAAFAVESAL